MAIRDNVLSMRWSKAREHGYSRKFKADGDLVYEWGDGCKSADVGMLHWFMACERQTINTDRKPGDMPWTYVPSLAEELVARGYDITTIRFSVKKAVAKDGRGSLSGEQVTPDAPKTINPPLDPQQDPTP